MNLPSVRGRRLLLLVDPTCFFTALLFALMAHANLANVALALCGRQIAVAVRGTAAAARCAIVSGHSKHRNICKGPTFIQQVLVEAAPSLVVQSLQLRSELSGQFRASMAGVEPYCLKIGR